MNRHPSPPLVRFLAFALLLPTLASHSGNTPAGDPGPVTEPAGLSEGWNEIPGGGESMCALGTPFHFNVRPGDPEKLLVWFVGGGGCWDGATCDPDLAPTYPGNLKWSDPSWWPGILDFANPDNPFAEHTAVFVPYCSADMHLGSADVTYQAPPAEEHQPHDVQILHRGAANVETVLDWIYENVPRPTEIFVAGGSAGAMPTPVYAALLARRYPDARTAQLGNGIGGMRDLLAETRAFEQWGTLTWLTEDPAFGHLTPETLTPEALYVAAAQAHPGVTFARMDTAEDAVQLGFLHRFGPPVPSLQAVLEETRAQIDSQVDNVRSFVAGGSAHDILTTADFYTLRVGDVLVREWVERLATGTPVEHVTCEDCSVPEGVTGSTSTAGGG